MEHVYWVIDGVLCGRPGPGHKPWHVETLYENGVRGIVSLDNCDVDEAALEAAGIEHLPVYLPMMLLFGEPERRAFLERLPPVFRFIDRMRQHEGGVLIHCYFGCDRTGAALACYMMSREGLSAEQAIERLRRGQPQALTAPGYAEVVDLFARLKTELS